MTTAHFPFSTFRAKHALPGLLVLTALFVPHAKAQSVTLPVTGATAMLDLPDAPGVSTSSSSASNGALDSSSSVADASFQPEGTPHDPASTKRTKQVSPLAMTIEPDEIAPPLTVGNKALSGIKDSLSIFAATGWLASAGWEQLTNGSPNYGTNGRAFSQRLGAAALRDTTETIFSESLFAPVFHEDLRYYKMGKGNNFFKRAIYAGTRVIITKTDDGHATPNLALFAGNAAGAALTTTYYPSKNTTFTEVASTFGGGLGGTALGNVVTEFLDDALQLVHIKKAE